MLWAWFLIFCKLVILKKCLIIAIFGGIIIFDGEHSFVIEDNQDGTITFKHEEIFNGLLVGPFSKKLDRDTKAGFETMNQKLKELAEA